MADKVVTIAQPAGIQSVVLTVRRNGATTEMYFSYQPPNVSPAAPADMATVLDSELTAGDRTNLNTALLAAYNIAKTKMGY